MCVCACVSTHLCECVHTQNMILIKKTDYEHTASECFSTSLHSIQATNSILSISVVLELHKGKTRRVPGHPYIAQVSIVVECSLNFLLWSIRWKVTYIHFPFHTRATVPWHGQSVTVAADPVWDKEETHSLYPPISVVIMVVNGFGMGGRGEWGWINVHICIYIYIYIYIYKRVCVCVCFYTCVCVCVCVCSRVPTQPHNTRQTNCKVPAKQKKRQKSNKQDQQH